MAIWLTITRWGVLGEWGDRKRYTSVVSFTNPRSECDSAQNNGPPSLNLRVTGPTLLAAPLNT